MTLRIVAAIAGRYLLALGLLAFLSACGGGGSSGGGAGPSTPDTDTPTDPGTGGDPDPDPDTDPEVSPLDQWLRAVITTKGLTGDPATPRQQTQAIPDSDPTIKLGQLLFFSHTLSGDLTSSCATCHQPDFGGGDGLSLGIGVAPEDVAKTGPERRLNNTRDLDPAADGGPNMHRNSQTIFNSALFDRSMTFDGRVFVLDEEVVPGGKGQAIRTPESGNVSDSSDADGILEVFVKFPLTNHNEMRAYLFSAESQEEYREHLVKRLRGELDEGMLSPEGPQNWLSLFRDAFDKPDASAEEVITLVNIQRALAAYIESMIFIESAWKRYVEGNDNAISLSAMRGARLFYEPLDEGGLGCSGCHSGDFFTNEKFYNVAFPQIGRGFMRAEKDDIGRWASTRKEEDKYAFRVPSLLNIGLTMPYGHAGTFDLLQDAIRYHANPRQGIEEYDFSLSGLAQYQGSLSYDYAQEHTRKALNANSFLNAEPLLPGRPLTGREISDLTSFLRSLTDDCVRNHACRNQWTPALTEDPDGNLLVRGENPIAQPEIPEEPGPGEGEPEEEPPVQPENYAKKLALNFTAPPRDTFAELEDCSQEPSTVAINAGLNIFAPRHMMLFGLYDLLGNPNHPHGFSADTWGFSSVSSIETTMIAGGVSSGYLDDDCWLDLAYAGGERSGIVMYKNRGDQLGFEVMSLLDDDPGGLFTGVAMADLNGDYRKEILFGNLKQKKMPVYSENEDGFYSRIADFSMSRSTYGISFGDVNGDGFPDIYLAHWFSGNVLTAPAFWRNNSGEEVEYYDAESGLSQNNLLQDWNFSPAFYDANDDGSSDLLLASDFGTSVVMQNDGSGAFDNVTDRDVINDNNGMGSALGDYDNDGDLDWFVTSIYVPELANSGWGGTGNKLYENVSEPGGVIQFDDVSESAGVSDGVWAWGACFADFNNDGYLDIFHVNGFGYIDEHVVSTEKQREVKEKYDVGYHAFMNRTPRLFINRGDGTFDNQALEWGLVLPSNGRGVSCLDYDRDGDMDVTLLDHSKGLQFFSNQTGNRSGSHFLSVRLVGEAPNTEALGAKVQVTADVGGGFGVQTQTRVSMANTNFNSQNPPDLHFGLGSAQRADIAITWPDGVRWQCEEQASNRFLIFDQRSLPGTCAIAP